MTNRRGTAGLLLAFTLALLHLSCSKGAPRDHDSEGEISLLPGLGSLHFPISTKKPEAQRYFDQGMLLYYGFNLHDARRSFEHASEIDSSAAMAEWGIALTLGPTYNGGVSVSLPNEQAGFAAIQKAKTLAARSATTTERAYIDALGSRFTDAPQPDLIALEKNYVQAMHDVTQKYPDDPDAGTLYAESMMDLRPYQFWKPDGDPVGNTLEIESVLEAVLKHWPNHIGANHYYVHLMEMSSHPEKALASAHLLEVTSPGAGHLVHMACHIYASIGEYGAAVRTDLAAMKADEPYLRNINGNDFPYVSGYAQHNLLFLARVAGMTGEFEIAYQAASELEAEAQQHLGDGEGEDGYLVPKILVLARFARWDEILKLPPPSEELHGVIFFWHYARGCALAVEGHAAEAEQERDAMQTTYSDIVPSQTFGMLFHDWSAEYDIAVYVLNARILTAQRQDRKALQRWEAAVTEQDQMDFHEPPGWYYPVRESLGGALLKNGLAVQAENVFREDLIKNPHNPRSLFGYANALAAQQKTAEAKRVRAEFDSVWKGTQIKLRTEDF
jgi:tetratricopeptide (TPR) repeat protein